MYWYHPQDHCLVLIGPPPTGDVPVLVVTGVPWRTGWRYRERGYRHIYWDAGTMLSQVLAAAASAGVTAHLLSRFPDQAVAELVGADGVNEWPVAIVSLGVGTPTISTARPGGQRRGRQRAGQFGLVTSAHGQVTRTYWG